MGLENVQETVSFAPERGLAKIGKGRTRITWKIKLQVV